MAIRFMIRNTTTNTTLAQRDFANDSEMVDRIQALFPTQTAESALDFMLRFLREAARHKALVDRRTVDSVTVTQGAAAEAGDFDADWPE